MDLENRMQRQKKLKQEESGVSGKALAVTAAVVITSLTALYVAYEHTGFKDWFNQCVYDANEACKEYLKP
jgi:hypothetical protein